MISFLNRITDAYRTNPQLANLMLDPFFKDVLSKTLCWLVRENEAFGPSRSGERA